MGFIIKGLVNFVLGCGRAAVMIIEGIIDAL